MIEKLRRRMRGYWRRFWVVLLPGIPINSIIVLLVELGAPLPLAAFGTGTVVCLGIAAVLSWQENPPE